MRDGLLEVVDAELLEAAALLDGGGDRVAVVGVEAQIFAAAQKVAGELEELVVLLRVDVLPPAAPVHADLEGAEAALPAVSTRASISSGCIRQPEPVLQYNGMVVRLAPANSV